MDTASLYRDRRVISVQMVQAVSKAQDELTLRHAQGQVFNSTDRFRVLVAGRRFGKSYLSCIELLRGAIDRPGETFFYCAPTYRCLLYTSPSPRDRTRSRMPSSA